MSDSKGFDSKDKELFSENHEDFLSKLKSWHDAAAKNRQIFDWNWYLFDNYYRGNHYIQFNKRTNQIVTPQRPKGQVRFSVNKIYSIIRAIRNFVTSYRPKWSVAANSTTEEKVNSGRKSAETLDYYYDYLEIPKLIKGVTNYAAKYGIGFFQYGYDDEVIGLDGQPGECAVWVRDPFDVYLDPAGMETGNIQNCRFIDIAVSRPIQDILNNPHYNVPLTNDGKKLDKEDVSADTKRAASDFKQSLISNLYSDNFSGDDELATKILHETHYKKRVTVEVTTKGKDGKKVKTQEVQSQIWVATWIEGHLLRNEKTEFKRYNLIPVPSDNNPNEIYGEGYIKNLIPVIKVLNRLESQIVEYNNLVNRGRFLADKDSGMTKITNETGEIIEKKAGATVTHLNPAGLSPDIQAQIQRMNKYLEEISGVTDAFQGNAPQGVTAGIALESLKAQTANNLQDLKDNVELALAQLGEGILEMLANKLITSRTIHAVDKDGKPAPFKIKGQVGVEADEELPEGTYVIGNQNKVKVVIGSELAYTREGRLARLDKLLEQKVIAPETYLKAIEFGDVEGAVKASSQAQFNDAMLENLKKNGMPGQQPPVEGMPPQGAPAGGMPPANPAQPAQEEPDSWEKLADDENQQMLLGKVIPPTENAPREHTAIHIAWGQSDEVQENENLMKALFEHIRGEEEMQGMSVPPVKAENAS